MRVGVCTALACAVLVLGCGAGEPSVVARVGGTAIAKAQLEHWVKVFAAGDPPAAGTPRAQALRRQALRFLISADWLIGEARRRGIEIAPQEVARAVAAQVRTTSPGGAAEEQRFLASIGGTVADLRFEAQARLAAARVRGSVLAAVAPVTAADVASYYRRNAARYAVPELREVLITNRKTVREARQIKREVRAGRSFSDFAHPETFATMPIEPNDTGRPLKLAIAAAKVGVLVGPLKARVDDFVFQLRRVTPARRRSLAEVSHSIATQLLAERRRDGFAAFQASWAAGWRARTDCSTGYVVDFCRQYRGPHRALATFGLP